MTGRRPLAGRVVAASCRRPWLVLLLALALGGAALLVTIRDFAITTDTTELISPELDWRRQRAAFTAAFPQHIDSIVVVIDAATPEQGDAAAAALAARLQAEPQHVRRAWLPEGGPFLERHGLLLLPLSEVQATTERLIAAQPLLGPLAADPGLRGVLSALATILDGVRRGEAGLGDIRRMMADLADAFEAAAAGRPTHFSWRRLMATGSAVPSDGRRILLVQPVLDFGALEPGAAASAAIRQAAREIGLEPARGVTVRLTGAVPLADEEFATLAQDAVAMTSAMLIALLGILWLAVRSTRYVLAILATTLLGLLLTTGLGLLAVGRFNLISVAFIPLFVGLGIDFAIQVAVRSQAERPAHPRLAEALAASGAGLGSSLALAAAAVAAGFFAFLPTSYVGVSELGAIAGLGMGIAFAMSLTVLPALLVLLRPKPRGGAQRGSGGFARAEAAVRQHRTGILLAGAVAALASVALLPWLRFDFDPLHLRNPHAESVSTLAELLVDPDRTPNTIDILAPSLTEADALARRLAVLPEVSRAVTLSSLIPARQGEKLALIEDAAMLLAPTFEAGPPPPAPTDAALVQQLRRTAAALRDGAEAADATAVAEAHRLAAALDALAAGPAAARDAAAAAVTVPLETLLRQIRTLLQAGPVTWDTLPPDLVADWMATDGRARILVFPHGEVGDNDGLRGFVDAVRAVAPGATGTPVIIREAGDSIVLAFLQAAALSAITIALLLYLALRRLSDVGRAMLPVLLSGLLTLGSCVLLDEPLNFANIIALPLLLGIGVAFNIYFVSAWRAEAGELVHASLMRAVVFSALTTATAFGALWISSHPGTASMGRLLMMALGWELAITLLFRPALLARPPATARPGQTSALGLFSVGICLPWVGAI
ncbi:MMPL family transporter [Roseicella aquatilis]|uniref:Hopanoid biosynthesis-associated RND transporter HpnN n=1 Tax=Roseicella aquatilis TaxID=2527868 RepID=A0A4R4DTN2_9PROT|nr:MMPL family transporter [Roseicella aquatilis]TCZ64993.1 hopanoid biosynthesis-associated RND transporter HpnN [Roseicella aquatilis]